MTTLDLAQIQFRRDPAATWTLSDPILGSGEIGIETDTHLMKLGDGATLWSALTYMAPQLAAQIHLATAKTTPADADLIPISDSAASFGLKSLSWANCKATLKTYFDTLYTSGAGFATIASPTFTGTVTIPAGASITDPKITRAINAQTGTTYTFVLADVEKEVTTSNAAAVAASIPTNVSVNYPVGATIYGKNKGAGLLTIAAVTPATTTVLSQGTVAASPTVAQYGSWKATQILTDVWYVTGDVVKSTATIYTPATVYLGANVAIASANTFYDGPSTAALVNGGVYLISAAIQINPSGASNESVTAKLWDGTTVYGEQSIAAVSGSSSYGVFLSFPPFLYTAGNTNALKVSVAAQSSGMSISRNGLVNSPASNKATYITAQRIS